MRSDDEYSGFAAILLVETKELKPEIRARRLMVQQEKAKRRKLGMPCQTQLHASYLSSCLAVNLVSRAETRRVYAKRRNHHLRQCHYPKRRMNMLFVVVIVVCTLFLYLFLKLDLLNDSLFLTFKPYAQRDACLLLRLLRFADTAMYHYRRDR
jgi:hypothetical protein